MKKYNRVSTTLIYIFFIILCILFLYPFVCVLSVSLSTSSDIKQYGFSLIPRTFDFSAYIYIFKDAKTVLSAYGTTISVSVAGTAIGIVVTSLYSYAVSRRNFKYRHILGLFVTFTMFFSAGMAAQYVNIVNTLHLKNSFAVLVLPGAFSAMNMIIMRSYYMTLPESMIESAKIDGANEYQVFAKIIIPLAKPAIATICLTLFVSYWNAYYEAMMYMDYGHYTTIQLLLKRMLDKVDFLKNNISTGLLPADVRKLPGESLRMAMCVLTVAPMVLIFPRFQKYFVKGMAVGSVKE